MERLNIVLKPGTYVAAVSGGIDSMVLLDVLARNPQPKTRNLIVAHFDHGIRKDSKEDAKLVETMSQKYKLTSVIKRVELGSSTSEAKAREARYNFLRQVRKDYKAVAILTAHHQDDLLETAILNLLRGTGRKGMSSLKSTKLIQRPFLHVSKDDLLTYAKEHKLKWREDSTNQDEAYLRNYVRLNLLSKFTPDQKQQLLQAIEKSSQTNQQIDELLDELDLANKSTLERGFIVRLPDKVAAEVINDWLKAQGVQNIDKKMVNRTVVAIKTYQSGKQQSLDKQHALTISAKAVSIKQL